MTDAEAAASPRRGGTRPGAPEADDSTREGRGRRRGRHAGRQGLTLPWLTRALALPRPSAVQDALRQQAESWQLSAWERLGSRDREPPSAVYRRLRRHMLAAERDVFLQARDDGRIDEEVVAAILRELDVEEILLDRG